MIRITLTLALIWTSSSASLRAFDREDPLAGLQQERPRILFTAEGQKHVEKLAETDDLLARLIKQNSMNAEAMLDEERVRYEIPDGKRLLHQSRKCVERVLALSLEYRLSGERRFAQCAIQEMLTAGKFKNWNPSHFLDVGEMTAALAIGYDWLYDEMTPDQRAEVKASIIKHGLLPGLRHYQSDYWWTRSDSNWNQVCNGGMIIGALALGDEEPALAKQIMEFALKSIGRGLEVYNPSGAYPEGPGYWQYGTVYTALTISSLRTALGHDFDIHKTPGLDRTCNYRVHTLGPLEHYFNYADGGVNAGKTATVFMLAQVFDQPLYSWWHRARLNDAIAPLGEISERRQDRFFPLEIVFYDPRGSKPSVKELPLDFYFRNRQDVVTMRSSWDSKEALFLGFKGGDNQTNHGHLDIGSFVFDWGGVRWAHDLGKDDYNLPGYFRSKRWSYYRLINASHNTLVIDGKLQNDNAVAKISTFVPDADNPRAVTDISEAYAGQANAVRRGVALVKRRALQVSDEIVGLNGEVRWGMVTAAKIDLQGDTAILSESGKRLRAKIIEPKDAQFEINSTKPPTGRERSNEGTSILAVKVKRKGDVTITILLQPEEGQPEVTPLPGPLAGWGE
jgi:hypothetical protein